MAEEELNHTQVGAMVKQVRGEGVTQRVRRQMLVDSSRFRMASDAMPERLPGHRSAASGRKKYVVAAVPLQ